MKKKQLEGIPTGAIISLGLLAILGGAGYYFFVYKGLPQGGEALQNVLASGTDPVAAAAASPYEGKQIRIDGDDKIYPKVWVVRNGQKLWVTSMDVFNRLGLKTADTKRVAKEIVYSIPDGPALV